MKSGRPVLLIEDDEIDRLVIKRVFKKVGLSNPLICLDNGSALFQWLQQHTPALPALILLDLNLPGADGLEILARLKTDPYYNLIPIIILTTSNDPTDRKVCFRHGVVGYMIKTIDPELYTKKINAIIDYWSASEVAH